MSSSSWYSQIIYTCTYPLHVLLEFKATYCKCNFPPRALTVALVARNTSVSILRHAAWTHAPWPAVQWAGPGWGIQVLACDRAGRDTSGEHFAVGAHGLSNSYLRTSGGRRLCIT